MSKPKTPPPPPIPPVTPMPDPGDVQIKAQKRREAAAKASKSGRQATLLSQSQDSLG